VTRVAVPGNIEIPEQALAKLNELTVQAMPIGQSIATQSIDVEKL
jgi:hypothetical protein